MGNINSQTGQISGSRFEGLHTEQKPIRPYSKVSPQIKVLPDPESRQRLKHTNNGEILQSGGTLSGRHQAFFRNTNSKPFLPTQRYSFHKDDLISTTSQNKQYASSQSLVNSKVKSFKSEPDLRFPSSMGNEMREKRSKKKYKAPPPPNNKKMVKPLDNWEESITDGYPIPRRTRLFKTREETKKGFSSHINPAEANENTPDIVEEKILANQNSSIYVRPNRLSLPEFNLLSSVDFKKELKGATERLKDGRLGTERNKENFEVFNEVTGSSVMEDKGQDIDKRFIRGEPSGKESSTPELSPVLRVTGNQKPRAFYFGMEKEDSDVSSTCHIDEDDEHSTIALQLRPVLPRKPPQIPHFSPTAAWRLLDSRSQDSGISGDARPLLLSSWTPQQDLGDDSSLEDVRRELPKSLPRQRPHVFSLSLPRDLQPASFTTLGTHKTNVNSLRRLKRSVSGVLNTLSTRKEPEHRTSTGDQDDANWFFSRSAPNSINDNSPDFTDMSFSHISPTPRLMYLPENSAHSPSIASEKYNLSVFSKSCEELKMPESLRDAKNVSAVIWSKGEPSKKHRKFTFQSTVRQIERRRLADKLSREAEKKERQRLRELEAMRRVEEEFQQKRAKEKANIRHQLRLYAMDENQWTSLPFELNDVKLEERQEPEGAISSSASSPAPTPKYHEMHKNGSSIEVQKITHVTQELSEYRQIQRDYKEYRGMGKLNGDIKSYRPTTVHPEVTCNMPNAKGLNYERGNYRKDFAYGIKSSVNINQLEDSPKMYRHRYSPITRF
ncbi:unnamed protein product [Ceutorhynchus assimilis]|uniref:Uncharacterized protein n=1 Tax=Ceutorhynchus assimilis TaxID=467358 RepID=A0A9N9Q873_9CUCU|nr:unnamed protein product [Ceutorhynchus assimilis]